MSLPVCLILLGYYIGIVFVCFLSLLLSTLNYSKGLLLSDMRLLRYSVTPTEGEVD